jgi:hypothetical protein
VQVLRAQPACQDGLQPLLRLLESLNCSQAEVEQNNTKHGTGSSQRGWWEVPGLACQDGLQAVLHLLQALQL